MFVPIAGVTPIPFNETGLIASAISSGNVGTIVSDILILNNDFEKVGYVDSKFIAPVVGIIHDVQKSHIKSLSLPIEVYQNKTTTLIQFRSTVREGRVKEFLKEIAGFFQTCKFKHVTLLSSISIMTRPDKEILTSKRNIYFIENEEFKTLNAGESILTTAELNPMKNLLNESTPDIEVTDLLSGSGLTLRFLKKKEFKGIPMFSLLIFSGEGYDVIASLYECRAFSRAIAKSHPSLAPMDFDEKDPLKTFNNKLPSYINRL